MHTPMHTSRPVIAMSLTVAAALAAFAGSASAQVPREYNYLNEQGQLSSRPLYPAGRADSVRRPGFNGRLWISRPIIGGMNEEYPLGWGDPGPAAYGADEYSSATVHARIGQVDVTLSPWEYVQGQGNGSLAMSRNKWLSERGYTGGVRTFVNDLFVHYYASNGDRVASAESANEARTGGTQPRATIHMPLDQPRFRSRMQVNAGSEAIVTLASTDSVLHVSWPESAPANVKSRTSLVAAKAEACMPPIRVITSTPATTPTAAPAIASVSITMISSDPTSQIPASAEPAPVVSNAEVK